MPETGGQQQFLHLGPTLGPLGEGGIEDLPPVDIGKDLDRFTAAVLGGHIFRDPGDEVVLERALDDLVEEVRGQKFVNVGTGKVGCKWLVVCQC